ncbi:MAG: hypothetical protein CMJ23_06845 [Phycisphaerae bacterium]|nr:hypothetical protein [Phycisphaerae bacterium]
MKWQALVLASVATLLLSPCLLFGFVGFLHSREIGWPNGAMFIYLVAEVVLLSSVGVIWWFAKRWRPRGRLDICEACDYDLRHTADRRCPECGWLGHP